MRTTINKAAQQDTRTRLLRASLSVFGHRDFDAVSVREIVDLANANIAAVSYHFGGKQALYLATAEFLAEAMQSQLAPLLARIRATAEDADAATAGQLLDEMIHALVQSLLMDRIGDDAAGFILREQHQPTAAFEILFERLMLPIQQTYQLLVTRILVEGEFDTRKQVLITHALLGQIISFRTARTTVLRRLGQQDFSDNDVNEIAELISTLTLNALHTKSTGRPSS